MPARWNDSWWRAAVAVRGAEPDIDVHQAEQRQCETLDVSDTCPWRVPKRRSSRFRQWFEPQWTSALPLQSWKPWNVFSVQALLHAIVPRSLYCSRARAADRSGGTFRSGTTPGPKRDNPGTTAWITAGQSRGNSGTTTGQQRDNNGTQRDNPGTTAG